VDDEGLGGVVEVHKGSGVGVLREGVVEAERAQCLSGTE